MTGTVILGITVMFNLGVWTRNAVTFGFPLGPRNRVEDHTIGDLSLRSIISNAVKNSVFHVATPIERLNDNILAGYYAIHRAINYPIEGTNLSGPDFKVRFAPTDEGLAGNPIHFALVPITLLALALAKGDWKSQPVRYALAASGTYFIFSALYAWQRWGGRLQLPFFILWAPVPAFAASIQRYKRAAAEMAIALFVSSLPFHFLHHTRPLITFKPLIATESILLAKRDEILFAIRPRLKEPYERIGEFARATGCRQIGLRLESSDFEYLWWWVFGSPWSGR